MDRVTSGTSTAITRGYTYDANSNQLTTTGTVAFTDSILPTSNQLSSTTGGIARTYAYDAAGNTTSYAGNTYTFNQRGRMSSVTIGTNETDYIYNALGQLVRKSGAGGTTLLMYDEAGHILGEYTASGALIQETIWMGDLPIATIQPNGASVAIYYVHTDHLGTPRKITRPSDNGLMWRWDPDTFGSVTPNTNPAGLGAFNYNLRFPGQYLLIESGLFYNYFRDYDPQTGRYIESDPIGQRGGINTYIYVHQQPTNYADPVGLFPMYGCWGGANWSGCYSGNEIRPDSHPPKDAFDSCYMKHDYCYARRGKSCSQGSTTSECDSALFLCLDAARDDGTRPYTWWGYPFIPASAAWANVNGFTHFLFGD